MPEIVPSSDSNPFDEIARTDAGGNQYWSARELMPLLGYDKWERFADAIERAKASAENSGADVSNNFPGAGKVVGSRGPAQADYRLTRYACYLVAMNGDPRKAEIAAAQTYFAVRTREAETSSAPRSQIDVLRTALDEIERVQQTAEHAQTTAEQAHETARESQARLDSMEGQRHPSALAYCKYTGRATDTKSLQRLGRMASTVGTRDGLKPGSTDDNRFGAVNTWPYPVWDEAARRVDEL